MTNHACPKCGHQPTVQQTGVFDYQWHRPWCHRCGFGEDDWDSYSSEEDAVNAWNRRVRRELAEQALALRAVIGCELAPAMKAVLRDYADIIGAPLRLPGEDAT